MSHKDPDAAAEKPDPLGVHGVDLDESSDDDPQESEDEDAKELQKVWQLIPRNIQEGAGLHWSKGFAREDLELN